MTRTVLTLAAIAAVGLAAYWAITKISGVHVTGTFGGVPVNANLTGTTGTSSGGSQPSDELAQQIGAAGGAAGSIITAIGGAFASSNAKP